MGFRTNPHARVDRKKPEKTGSEDRKRRTGKGDSHEWHCRTHKKLPYIVLAAVLAPQPIVSNLRYGSAIRDSHQI